MALFPTVLTLVAVLRTVRPALGGDAAPRVSADLARLLRVVLTAHGNIAADSADRLLRNPSSGLLGLGTAVSILVLARGLRAVQRGLTVIAGGAGRTARREWARAVLLSAILLIVGTVVLAAFTLGPLLGHSRQVGGNTSADLIRDIWNWLRWPLSAAALLGSATLLLAQETPVKRHRFKHSLTGAVVTVIGWTAATGLLPVYVALASRVSPTLGSLGGGLIVLVWVYLLNLSVFLGAEVNAARAELPSPDAPTERHMPLPTDETFPADGGFPR